MATASKKSSSLKAAERKKRQRRRVIYSVLVILVVGLLLRYIVTRPSSETSLVENGIGTLFTPVENALSTVTGFVRSWFGTSNKDKDKNLEERLEDLEIENDRLRNQLTTLEEVQNQLEGLQKLVDAKDEYEALSPVYAKVIARDTGMWFETFTINKGQNDGIATNMSVVSADGLVGRINQVGLNYSTVISIIDSRSSVAALISRTRDNGMLQGQTESDENGTECHMTYIANLGNIKVGDSVYTSGLDSQFPKGIYIGKVSAVSRSANSGDKYAIVQPAADFSSIENVFVLRELVESVDQLPMLVTPTPIPVATPIPTKAITIYDYVTPSTVNDNDIYYFPTPTPDPNTTPTPSPTPRPTKPNPEAAWLNSK